MILQIPYFLPSGAILRIYSVGSFHSSSVGRKVGASCKPCGRTLFTGSRAALGCPRRSTVDRSSGADLLALSGTLWEWDGWVLEVRPGCRVVEDGGLVTFAPIEAGATISTRRDGEGVGEQSCLSRTEGRLSWMRTTHWRQRTPDEGKKRREYSTRTAKRSSAVTKESIE